jgi:predicted Zn-dependent protease
VKSLIERDPDGLLYQTMMGEVRVAQRDYAGAEVAFCAMLSRNPDFSAATRDLAQLYAATGRTDDAKRIYTDVLKKNPTIRPLSASQTSRWRGRNGRKR